MSGPCTKDSRGRGRGHENRPATREKIIGLSATRLPRFAPEENTVPMVNPDRFPAEGGCDCRAVRYRMESAPLFVHCCHCRWCQRESGASFALNAMIEADRVVDLGQLPDLVVTPSASGSGQLIARCASCKVAIWSNYAGAGPLVKFVRVGTLDNPDLLPPDIRIFTASKQPWVVLPTGM